MKKKISNLILGLITSTSFLLSVPLSFAQSQANDLSPEQMDLLRQQLIDQQTRSINMPTEIQTLRQRELEAESADHAVGYENEARYDLQSRNETLISNDATTPYNVENITLAKGVLTSIVFFDAKTNEPWPVENVAFNSEALAINNDGCSTVSTSSSASQERQATSSQDFRNMASSMGNILVMRPCNFWTQTNVQVLLTGETKPISFSIKSGSRESNVTADANVTYSISSLAARPHGRDRIGQLDNSWVIPSARHFKIDPVSPERNAVSEIFLTPAITTDIAFIDGNKIAWPIEEVAFTAGVVAVNGACEPEEAGIKKIKADENVSTIYVTPCQNATATIAVKLKNRSGAISLKLSPARQGFSQPDGSVTITVTGVSPLKQSLSAAAAGQPAEPNARQTLDGFKHDRYLNEFLMGTPPRGARRASISGSDYAEAWIYDGALYIRGSLHVINPAFDAKAISTDGTISVFKYGPPIQRLLASDLSGREMVIKINY